MLYFDLIYASLSEAARRSLLIMDPAKYEFQSEFAKRYLAQGRAQGEATGRAQGEAAGRAEALLQMLAVKFEPLDAVVVERVRAASLAELERWTKRVLSAMSLDEVLL